MSTPGMRGFTAREGDTEGACIQAGLACGQVSKCGSPTRCKQCLQTWTVCPSSTRPAFIAAARRPARRWWYVISTPLQLGRQHNPG